MKRVEIERGFILVSLVFISFFSLLILSDSGSISSQAVVSGIKYDVGDLRVSDSRFNVDVEGIKSVFIPGEEKPLTVSVQNNGDRTVNKCRIRSSGSGSCYSDLVTNINPGEIVDFPVVIGVVDEFPKIWLECVEGERDININFIIYTLDVSAEILNVNFEGNNLVINYRVTTDVDFNDAVSVRVTDSYGNIVKSVEKQVSCSRGDSVDERIIVEVDSDTQGLLNVAVLQGSAVLVEDTVIYGRDTIDVTGKSIWDVYSDGTFVYIFVMVLFFVFIAVFVVVKIVRNVKGVSRKRKKR